MTFLSAFTGARQALAHSPSERRWVSDWAPYSEVGHEAAEYILRAAKEGGAVAACGRQRASSGWTSGSVTLLDPGAAGTGRLGLAHSGWEQRAGGWGGGQPHGVGQALTFAEDAGSGVGCERREGTRREVCSGSGRAGRPVGEDPGVEGPLCRGPPSPEVPGCGQGVGSGSAHVMIRALELQTWVEAVARHLH